jgi:hypothetical protein
LFISTLPGGGLFAVQRKEFFMMNYIDGWMGGGMWIWTVIGALVVVLIIKLSKK